MSLEPSSLLDIDNDDRFVLSLGVSLDPGTFPLFSCQMCDGVQICSLQSQSLSIVICITFMLWLLSRQL